MLTSGALQVLEEDNNRESHSKCNTPIQRTSGINIANQVAQAYPIIGLQVGMNGWRKSPCLIYRLHIELN